MDIDEFPFKFKKDSHAVFFEDYAVVGDIHLGFEEEINDNGYNIWDKTEEITENILRLNSKKLILLGDLRKGYTEILPREGGILIKFLSILSNKFDEIIITKGNHDGGLEKISNRFKNISVTSEFIHRNVGFMHGHALPSMKLAAESKFVCLSHLHPSVILRDSNGVIYQQDCFLFLNIKLPKKKYKDSTLTKGLVVPKFNEYIGSSGEIDRKGLMKYAKVEGKLTTNLVML